MPLIARWSIIARRDSLVALPPAATQERVSAAEAEALFATWEASQDRGAFVMGISLVQASALCDLIAKRVSSTRPPQRTKAANYGMGGDQRRARKRRIAELLDVTPDEVVVSDVYTALRHEYGACPVPRLITSEMVAEACKRLGWRAKQ